MKKIFFAFILVFLLPRLGFSESESARNLIHLLSYIASDYGGAVQHGQVISNSEYEEQVEFSKTVLDLAGKEKQFQSSSKVQEDLLTLRQLILKKSEPEKIREVAYGIQTEVFKISGLQRSPRKWPNIQHGKQIYSQNCTQCHGVNGQGDGPSSGSLDPKPTNFLDSKIDFIPPFQLFNAIHLGVPGTAMSAFSQLSENETWDLAFYIASLRHEGKNTAGVLTHPWTLEQVASMSDRDLLLSAKGLDKNDSALALARTFNIAEGSEKNLLSLAQENLEASFQAFENKNFELAKAKAIAAYLDGIEPLEPKLRLNDPDFTLKIEQALSSYRKDIDARVEKVELEKSFQNTIALIEGARKVLDTKPSSFWVTFSVAAGIFIREALEAALLLITLLGVVRSLGSSRALYFIHGGWIGAIVVGIGAWFFSGWIVKISGLGRELLEGSISLLAVVVLLYFGFWLHRKTEIGKWRAFINNLVKTALDSKKLIGLAVVAFMGVFREAFETILFLRALQIESNGQDLALTLGVLSAFLVVLVASGAAVRYSARLPLKQLFSLSSGMMLFLALILIGKAVHAFQEAGVLNSTAIQGAIRIEWLGLFPSLESLIPQSVLLIIVLITWGAPKLRKSSKSFSVPS